MKRKNIVRISNVIAKLLRDALKIIENWATKISLIEWYEAECKKNSIAVVFAVHSVDGDLYTYTEQIITRNDDAITTALKDVKTKVGSCVTTGYVVIEDGLIKKVIEQHITC